MKARFASACLAAGALMLPAAAFAADSGDNTYAIQHFVDESLITTKIKALMAKAKPSTLVNVSVATDKSGAVTLGGTAKTGVDKNKAESIARSVDGVKTVENNIQIKAN
ncbi:MAG TPA: BON domain-containing protein [Burkholderiales bacterium]|jgi:hyperosmotically inducible protein